MWALILTKSLIEDYLTPDMLASLGSIQYEMDAKYQEKSMLTNLFTEHKFWGWVGLLLIFITICVILVFQVRSWEEEDHERNLIK
tara:strand:- start:67 stop:321 length:255 start_codon:yes stop_codon:yes gene_type:complete